MAGSSKMKLLKGSERVEHHSFVDGNVNVL